jgi:hypothetical protein
LPIMSEIVVLLKSLGSREHSTYAANQTILCWICWKGPWGQVHFYFFLCGVCSMTDWFIKCEEQLRLQVLKTSSK